MRHTWQKPSPIRVRRARASSLALAAFRRRPSAVGIERYVRQPWMTSRCSCNSIHCAESLEVLGEFQDIHGATLEDNIEGDNEELCSGCELLQCDMLVTGALPGNGLNHNLKAALLRSNPRTDRAWPNCLTLWILDSSSLSNAQASYEYLRVERNQKPATLEARAANCASSLIPLAFDLDPS